MAQSQWKDYNLVVGVLEWYTERLGFDTLSDEENFRRSVSGLKTFTKPTSDIHTVPSYNTLYSQSEPT